MLKHLLQQLLQQKEQTGSQSFSLRIEVMFRRFLHLLFWEKWIVNGEKREALCTYMEKSSPNLSFISHIFGIHFFILICEVFILRNHKKLLWVLLLLCRDILLAGYCSCHGSLNLPANQKPTRMVTLKGYILHKFLVNKSPGGAGVSTDEKSNNK